MIDRRANLTIGVGALAGCVAGFLVGWADGIRAAWLFGTRPWVAIHTGVLAAAVDACVGFGAGALVELVGRLVSWGRQKRPPLPAWLAALGVSGLGAGAAAAGMVVATATRNNRFLAAGLVVLVGFGTAFLGLLLAPAFARAVSGGRSRSEPIRPPSPVVALLGPLLASALGAVVFASLSGTRAPLLGRALTRHAALAAWPAVLLTLGLAALADIRLPSRIGWRRAGGLAGLVYGGAALVALGRSWNDNLRFAPWVDIIAGAALAAVAVGLALASARRLPQRSGRTALFSLGLALAAAAVVGWASESEPARKAAGARAAFVGPALALGRRFLDFDGDGYARALGGGDCDDSDPDIHPGALDLPGDGIDADCDGQDATLALPPSARLYDLPPAVPADLNLLLITIDTLRADHLGCYGYPRPTSPAIDALAAAGALFDNGFAHAPSTRYSMPAIASGRWPSAIAWDESIWWPRLAPDVRTTAQALHDLGLFTGGLFSFSYFALADHRGFERAMDVYRSDRAALHVAVNGPMESRGSSSREMTDDAIAFVDAHRDRRFFLWLHYYDPHLSYEVHPEVPSFGSSQVDLYDGEIRFTDLHLGRLLEHLRSAGLWDRTAIVLTGDHGEGFGEHGVTTHGFDLYPAQTKVPFIVRVPGLAPRRVRAPVGHIDIAPTLVNLARGHSEPSFIGRSLVPDLAGPPAPDTDTRAVFQEVTSERGKKRALLTTTRHLLWNAVPGDTTECYDRTVDPGDTHDIWEGASGDASCLKLAGELRRLVAGLALPPGAAEALAQAVTPPGAVAPVPSHAMGASLGDAFSVVGYDVGATQVRAGDAVEETTHFVVKNRVAAGWRLFFHLEGPAGYRNLDHVPAGGLLPLERWRPGQQIRDRLHIPISPGMPPGLYTVYLGAFRGGDRMHVAPASLSDGKDRLRLFTFTVLR